MLRQRGDDDSMNVVVLIEIFFVILLDMVIILSVVFVLEQQAKQRTQTQKCANKLNIHMWYAFKIPNKLITLNVCNIP